MAQFVTLLEEMALLLTKYVAPPVVNIDATVCLGCET